MDSQLIVVDFSKVKRQIPFDELTGFTTDTVSYYRDDLFPDFAAYLFNYERWGERPLFQLVFLFEGEPEPNGVLMNSVEVNEIVLQSALRYAAWVKGEMYVVTYKGNRTICGYASTEKYPDLGNMLQWLVEPIAEHQDAEPSSGEDPAEPAAAPVLPY